MILEAQHVHLQLQKQTVLEDISLHVNAGEMLMILGSNGAGKSSLVKTLVGIHKPTSGKVKLQSNRFGYVPQKTVYVTGLTVLEMMQYFSTLKGYTMKDAAQVLSFVGLDMYQNHYIRQLSGGYLRKLTLAQALLGEPDLLILDEPFAGLDQNAIHALVELINRFFENGGTVILTTHVFHQPFPVHTRVAILNKGRLVANDAFENICSRIRLRILRKPGCSVATLLTDFQPKIEIVEQGTWIEVICQKDDRLGILNRLEKHQILLDWTEEHLWEQHDETQKIKSLAK